MSSFPLTQPPILLLTVTTNITIDYVLDILKEYSFKFPLKAALHLWLNSLIKWSSCHIFCAWCIYVLWVTIELWWWVLCFEDYINKVVVWGERSFRSQLPPKRRTSTNTARSAWWPVRCRVRVVVVRMAQIYGGCHIVSQNQQRYLSLWSVRWTWRNRSLPILCQGVSPGTLGQWGFQKTTVPASFRRNIQGVGYSIAERKRRGDTPQSNYRKWPTALRK